MPDYSLVPVDYQPDFGDYSLVPVDYDPFAEDGATQQAQFQQPPTATQPAQPQPQTQPQQPATGAARPNAGAPAAGDGPSESGGVGIGPTGGAPNPDQGAAKAAPFGGYANPTPTESLVNKAKMDDQEKIIEADPTGKSGFVVDGGDLYKFVTTRQSLARYPIDGGEGVVFTAIGPFYAYDGTRRATIDASPERPVTVTVRGDGTFTISRP